MSDIDALFLTKYDRKGASSRYRSLQYFPRFEAAGINCSHQPLFPDPYLETLYETGERPLLGAIRSYFGRICRLLGVQNRDVVVIEKELLPYAPAVFERLLGRLDTPYVVDYDDAIFHNYDRSENRLVRKLLGQKIDVVMRTADAVVAGNDYLASRARRAGASRVEVVPTVVDLDRYSVSPPDPAEPFIIGWIGSPTTARYVESIAPALCRVCDEQNATVVLVGAGDVEIPGVPLERRSWSEATETADIKTFDVGIMPLEQSPWELGKCGLKLIQYMACAKPVVTSPVGANADIVDHEENGLHADSETEWVEALSAIANDVERAERMGKAGRECVEDRYCLDVTAPQWIGLLQELATR